jgi:hypothetical protein
MSLLPQVQVYCFVFGWFYRRLFQFVQHALQRELPLKYRVTQPNREVPIVKKAEEDQE